MNIDVVLHGSPARWGFQGAREFSEWLARTPWLDRGGHCMLQVVPGQPTSPFIAAIKKAFYAENIGATTLLIEHVTLNPREVQSWAAVTSVLGISADARWIDQAETASRLLNQRTTIILLDLEESGSTEWFDELSRWLENLNKMGSSRPLTIVVVDACGSPTFEPTFLFTNGWPISRALAESRSNRTLLWNSYVHHRIAWEAGGHLVRSYQLSELTRGVQSGHDDTLEQIFNEFALKLRSDLATEVKRLVEQLEILHSHRSSISKLEESDHFSSWISLGLIWQPMGNTFRLTPWVARAIAHQKKISLEPTMLRSALICELLAEEILTLCFRAEAVVRGKLMSDISHQLPTESMKQALDDFSNRAHEFPFYPAGFPIPPIDAWSFATFGEILRASRNTIPQGTFHRLRLLRNSLAHGHYVCWEHVKAAAMIKTTFDL